MSRSHISVLLAGASLLAITSTMAAHAADSTLKSPLTSQELAADDNGTEEIIVTARRKAENLQDVPTTVNAVTSAQLQQLNLQTFNDIQQVVPGLTLGSNSIGTLPIVNFRGIGFFPDAATEQIVGFSLNNAFSTIGDLQIANFDIGQIEVDRGPQGTLRGEPAPAGTIAETTHAPDLERYGGTATGTVTQYGNVNINGAVNVPIIQDKLAVRLAGIVDMNNNDGIDSINSPAKPFSHTYGGRISLRYEPNDNITANVMYQHEYNLYASYGGTVSYGPGSPGIAAGLPVTGYALGTAGTPANYNGGPLTIGQNKSAGFAPTRSHNAHDFLTANLDYRFKGQLLEYIGSYSLANIEGGEPAYLGPDPASVSNPIPGDPNDLSLDQNVSHELRLSSNEPDRFWDYAVGGYFRRENGQASSYATSTYYPGAFGSPLGAAGITTFNPLFADTNDLAFEKGPSLVDREIAAYAHLTFHLPGQNELAFGGRYIDFKRFSFARDIQEPGGNYAATVTKTGVAITPAMCAAGGYALPGSTGTAGPGVFGAPYAGVCTASIPGKIVTTFNVANARYHPWIYSATLSHKFNDDIMAYFNSGSSWRPGGATIGVQNAIHDPGLVSLGDNPPEKSYSFEGGLKTTFNDKRGHFNIDYFHQIFDDYVYAGSSVNYLETVAVGSSILSIPGSYPGFTSHPNATVDGIELDTAYQVTKELNLSLNASWSKSEISGTIPCNPPTGFPTFPASSYPAGTYIFFCPGSGSATTDGKFTASAQAEYRKLITSDIEGFIRGQMTFHGVNPNCTSCVGKVVGSTFVIPAYQISNLFIGVRSADGAWEGSIFAKNVTNTRELLSNTNAGQISNVNTTFDPIFGNSGFYGVTVTPPREFGMTITYAFGSR